MKHLPKLSFKIRLIIAGLIVAFLAMWPTKLFDVSYSTVVTDADNQLLSAQIAKDGQWRFPITDSIPEKYKVCALMFEDEYFHYHPGVNPFSIGRAIWQNINSGKVQSGGSTITMQTVRLAKKLPRNIFTKLWESIWAIRLECQYSKDEIFSLYAAHAPYGGNVVGLETASWRYFGVTAKQLSWAEFATLAVLPNSPSLVNTQRNRHILKEKRDRLLNKLFAKGVIDEIELQLSIDEPVVPSPAFLPQTTPHLLSYYLKNNPGHINQTSINSKIQNATTKIVERHFRNLSANQIFNGAVVVVDNLTAKVIAYVGNTMPIDKVKRSNDVDIIQSNRSSGSILKPFLYAAALQEGTITPQCLLADVPTYYTDFSPQNYQRSYDGAVRADEALSRSLNIPAVRLLDDFGTDKFLYFLNKMGFSSLNKPASHYGLSLILGGGEVNLWQLASAYSSMARVLNNYEKNNHNYSYADIEPISFNKTITSREGGVSKHPLLMSASSIWFTFQALTHVQRPPEEDGWEAFCGSNRIAWKTGTSFGFRDAWAVGVTPQYTVAVWVGNANGEGRPGIVGGTAAAPIMFDVYRSLPSTSWFEEPFEDFMKAKICKQSGFVASMYCDDVDTVMLPANDANYPQCAYHKRIHLDDKQQYRVTEMCYPVSKMTHQNFFTLPPLMESYYRLKNPLYRPLPPFAPNCNDYSEVPMEFIYPRPNLALFIPKSFNGASQCVVLRVAHRNSSAKLFWHIDEVFIGQTELFHHIEAHFTPGWHTITVVDENGYRISRRIQCVNKE